MNPLSQEWRDKAAKMKAAANAMYEENSAENLTKTDNILLSILVGKIGAMLFESQADMLDYLQRTGSVSQAERRRQTFADKNDAIRRAAAAAVSTGDWNEFNRLVGPVEGSPVGSPG